MAETEGIYQARDGREVGRGGLGAVGAQNQPYKKRWGGEQART